MTNPIDLLDPEYLRRLENACLDLGLSRLLPEPLNGALLRIHDGARGVIDYLNTRTTPEEGKSDE